MKYIVVSGGVISGIGKGVIASSTGLLMKTQRFENLFDQNRSVHERMPVQCLL